MHRQLSEFRAPELSGGLFTMWLFLPTGFALAVWLRRVTPRCCELQHPSLAKARSLTASCLFQVWCTDRCTYQQSGQHLMVSLCILIAASPLFQLLCLLCSAAQTQRRL